MLSSEHDAHSFYRPVSLIFNLSCHLFFDFFFFFFNDTATTEIYTLSLHDALPISTGACSTSQPTSTWPTRTAATSIDRKSTRLNSSHVKISYAVFCLKKKNRYGDPEPRNAERGEIPVVLVILVRVSALDNVVLVSG